MKAWVIQVDAGGGNRFAVANADGKFSLRLVNGNVYRNCLCWPSEIEAYQYLEKVRKVEHMEKLLRKYKTAIVQIEIMQ